MQQNKRKAFSWCCGTRYTCCTAHGTPQLGLWCEVRVQQLVLCGAATMWYPAAHQLVICCMLHVVCCICCTASEVVDSQLVVRRRNLFYFHLQTEGLHKQKVVHLLRSTKRNPQPQPTTVGCGLWTYAAAGGTPAVSCAASQVVHLRFSITPQPQLVVVHHKLWCFHCEFQCS